MLYTEIGMENPLGANFCDPVSLILATLDPVSQFFLATTLDPVSQFLATTQIFVLGTEYRNG